MNLRPYQQSAADAICQWQYRRQLAVLPTGSGKTIIFADVASREPGRTLILCHRDELVRQAMDKLYLARGLVAEVEKADERASACAKVVVGSVQSLRGDRLLRWPEDHFSLIICDEAHHSVSDSWRAVLNHFGSAKVLGVTATPDRGDKRNLGEFYEHIAAEVPLLDLIRQGYLSPITVKSLPLQIDLSAVKSTAGDLDAGDLGDALEPYLGAIAGAIKEHAFMRRTLCFLPLIATSRKFVDACRGAGIRAEHVDGESPDRADILRRFARWEFDLLSNAMLLTEGYDDPGIDCLVVLRPTRSRPLFAQMVGRGTRVEPVCKENLLLLDFLWLHERHSITRPAHLIAENELEASLITAAAAKGGGQTEFDLEELATSAAADREDALRKQLADKQKRRGKTITAEEFALLHHDAHLADYEPVMKWERDAMTAPQAKMLKRAHIDLATVRGKGHASAIIGKIISGQKLTLASEAQRRAMRFAGAPNWQTATQADARKFFGGKK